jgi:nucleosome-remodeling factor subunit BPTF
VAQVQPTQVAQVQPTQVTAQLIQTPQGPRIVLQGIQGANLSKDQLQSIQQQVKDQLLKAQAEAKLQGKVPPTKIAIQLPPMTPAGPALTSPPLAVLPQQPQQIIANKTQVPTVVSNTKPITVNQVQTVTQSKSLLFFQNLFPKIKR